MSAKVAQQRCDHHPAVSNERLRGPHRDIRAEGIAPGHQSVTRWMTERAGCMGVGESHALTRQAVDVRRRDFRIRVEASGVAVAHVINQDDRDAWLLLRTLGSTRPAAEDGGN